MNSNEYGRRELLSLGTITLLGPALRLFPSGAAELAGRAGWLSALFAIPPALLYLWFLTKLMGARREGENLQELSLRLLGPVIGRAVLCLTALWFLLYAGFILRAGADRLVVTIYPNQEPYGFAIAMGLMALLATLGSARSLVRVARMIQPTVMGALLLILIFALFSVEPSNLLPLTVNDALPTVKGAVLALNIISLGIYSLCFLEGGTGREPGRFRAFALWVVILALLLCLLVVTIIGGFGAELTAILTRPFGVLVRNLVFFRTVERVEAMVVMLWVFPDFLLTSLSLYAAQQCLRLVLGKTPAFAGEKLLDFKNARYVIWLCGAAAILCSVFIAPDAQSMDLWSSTLIPWLNMAYAFGVLPLVYIIGKIKKTL